MRYYYDIQQVCLNGHQITCLYNRNPEERKDFCDRCGLKTIYKCKSCNASIRGCRVDKKGFPSTYQADIPEYCHNCGEPYPWAGKITKTNDIFLNSDPVSIIELIFTKFHSVVRQLRDRREDRETLDVQDEYDVQDLFHALLRLFFDDIRPEEWTPSYAGRSSRMDFLLKDESIVIEVKKTRRGLGAKEIGDELIIDIERYQEHPSCKKLFCFVYDPEERILNPQGVENDVSREEEDLSVKVFIVPKH